jgi:hypothetical protein
MPFETPLALVALASIIPLIILYLLRPKPLVIKVPSLLFLMQVDQKQRFSSIRRLFRDPIFLIQLFVLILLSTAAAAPYFISEEELSGDHTVLIIDASASMQADNRFAEAVSLARDYFSKQNTIILAKNVPETVLEGGSSGNAGSVLDDVRATGTVADLSAAISEGMRVLSDSGGNIVVFSDFGSWDGNDPVEAGMLAKSYGLDVTFIGVGDPVDNVGIVDGWIEQTAEGYDYNCIIKNYANSRKSIVVDIKAPGGYSEQLTLNIKGRSTGQFKLSSLGSGVTTIHITAPDSLSADNYAYVSIPGSTSIPCLAVTDTADLPSTIALSLLTEAKLSTAASVPSDLSNYKLIVVSKKEKLITGDETDLLTAYLNGGGNVVFIASDALNASAAGDLLPVEITGRYMKNRGFGLDVVRETSITDDVDFDGIALYTRLNCTPKDDATVLVATEDDVPMIAYREQDDGTVLYLGFNDWLGKTNSSQTDADNSSWNNFHNQPEYPVMWAHIFSWLSGTGDISDYNLETGTTSPLAGEREVTTPSDTITTDSVYFEKTGVYTIGGSSIAVNLYDDPESDTTVDPGDAVRRVSSTGEPQVTREDTYTAENHLEDYLLLLVILLGILEILIIRKRGEL